MHPVSIAGGAVALREFTPDDVDAILKVYGDPTVVEHLSFEPRNREQVAATLTGVIEAGAADPRTEYSLAVVARESAEAIGFARLAIDAQHPGQSSGQLGFALATGHWRRGLGTETVRLLLRLGFEELNLYRLWGARSPDNTASARLMTNLGMIEEGRIRGHIRVNDAWRDSVVHSILRPEWPGTPAEQ
ncbi:GNAT family N-acetyltransferase [Actinomadura sp. CNU-125]|uniref:GNAT family N-acetyltransferase n=1 Tax=Actinomadura sp. CNU-125 TaxID=1904961 RepID=UPI00096365EB|nr:GNAT family protein [Actinomadura sp. CNU-125]OLT19087.1 GNAT family N-acetyltransferase [Actinomadura sp. CNU-125]